MPMHNFASKSSHGYISSEQQLTIACFGAEDCHFAKADSTHHRAPQMREFSHSAANPLSSSIAAFEAATSPC